MATVIDRKPGQIRIAVARSDGCGACAQKSLCAPVPEGRSVMLDLSAADPGPVGAGEGIVVSIGAAAFARMLVLCYLAPAFLMLLGASLLPAIMGENSDLLAIAGAALGLAVGCALLRLYDARVGCPTPGGQQGPADREFPIILTKP